MSMSVPNEGLVRPLFAPGNSPQEIKDAQSLENQFKMLATSKLNQRLRFPGVDISAVEWMPVPFYGISSKPWQQLYMGNAVDEEEGMAYEYGAATVLSKHIIGAYFDWPTRRNRGAGRRPSAQFLLLLDSPMQGSSPKYLDHNANIFETGKSAGDGSSLATLFCKAGTSAA